MADHANSIALESPSFFRIFPLHILQNGTLELPTHFVKEHRKSLSKHAVLEVPTGEKSEMKMKISNGRAWLDKGWQNFADKYSISFGYFLVFKYLGRSNFIVEIFDLTTGQIKYPNTNQQKEVDFVKEEECDTEDREMKMDNQARKLECGQNYFSREALKSRNPNFSVIMKQTYVIDESGNSYMHIPTYATSYFHNKRKDDIIYLSLKGENGKVWSMKYYVRNDMARISSGWRDFSKENNLSEGDICTFEPLSSTDMIFSVTISRKNDEQAEATKRKRTSSVKVKEKSSAIECNETSFAVTLRKTNVEDKCRLNVPRAHSRIHLFDQNGKDILLHRLNGENWRVNCYNIGLVSRFVSGWKAFIVDNELQVGDICVFELCSRKPNFYKVAIFSPQAQSSVRSSVCY